MERIVISPRADWQQRVESVGMHYHTVDDTPYWDESAYYRFTPAEVDELEKATYELDRMCLEAVGHVVDNRHFEHFNIPEKFHDFVVESWETEEHTIYGRFDLACDGHHPPKLLEYNADTPTAL